MTETAGPASFGRVSDDGTVFVITPDGERMVGQIPDSTPDEALAFFRRRFEALQVEADLLSQRVKNGTIGPEEARKAIAAQQANILSAKAVGDLVGLAATLDGLAPLIDEAQAKRREEKARILEEARARKAAIVEQAEKLAEGNDWRGGVVKFREFLEEWKALPRLDKATDDDLWHKFSSGRTTYTRRRKAHFAELGEQHDSAREVKEQIIKEAEELAQSTEWGPTAAAFRALMDRWRTAGSAARGVDDELWAKFRGVQDEFFNRRSAVFSAQDKEFQANLDGKLALLDEAERTIVPVTDVAAARAAYRTFVAKFNELGKVPREHVRAVDGRVRALEAAIDEADRKEWARTDPQTRATAQGTVSLFSGKLDQLRADLAKAEAKGDQKRVDSLTSKIAGIEGLLAQATATLDDLSR
ncbi:MAG: DUF349 domain-containing protein [Propionibacteriaceae bacterium]|jgi:hypothetical protein|nr:DUF349 domain-containing protein [Propionibacteriaceae bacterium]